MKVHNQLILACFFIASHSLAQNKNVTYTIDRDSPDFSSISNLFITPGVVLDFSMYGPSLVEKTHISGGLGLSLRSHAIVKQRFIADFNFSRAAWPTDQTTIELGGGMILKTRTVENVQARIVLSEKSTSVYSTTVTYMDVPSTKMRFSGLRGGLLRYKLYFEDAGERPDVTAYTNTTGLYGGISWGSVQNLVVKVNKSKFKYGNYKRFYADLMLAGSNVVVLEGARKYGTGSPIGFRIGCEILPIPTNGIFGTVIQIEMGYRPGWAGFFIGTNLSFIHIRSKIKAFD